MGVPRKRIGDKKCTGLLARKYDANRVEGEVKFLQCNPIWLKRAPWFNLAFRPLPSELHFCWQAQGPQSPNGRKHLLGHLCQPTRRVYLFSHFSSGQFSSGYLFSGFGILVGYACMICQLHNHRQHLPSKKHSLHSRVSPNSWRVGQRCAEGTCHRSTG